MFKKLLKSALTLILTVLVTWAASIALWRALHHRPSVAELAVCLVGVPAALLAAISWWRRKPAEEPQRDATQPQATANAAHPPRWAILASDVMTPIGHTPTDVIQALQDYRRPELDATLTDPDGFPLFAARVADVDAGMPPASEALGPAGVETCTQDALRAAAMMLDICRNLAIAAADGWIAGAPLEPILQLHALLPARWPQAQRRAVLNGMRSTVSSYWRSDIEAYSHAVGDDDTSGPMDRIDLPALQDDTGRLRLAMVIGGDSYISADAVSSLAARQQLMTPTNPMGRVPGEAAAGILLCAPVHAGGFMHGPGVFMTPGGGARRPSATPAADTPQADAAEPFTALLDGLLAMTGAHVEAIKAMVSDASQRGPSGSEILAMAVQRLPHLDPAEDHLVPAAGCGDVGAAAFPLALALAAQASSEWDARVLLVSAPTARARMALVIEPASSVQATSPQARDAPGGAMVAT